MKLRLTLLTLSILSLAITASAQAKIEGYVSNDKGSRVGGLGIVVTPGGQTSRLITKGTS
jgi:hypothetical protein